jgi:hypothetical protein
MPESCAEDVPVAYNTITENARRQLAASRFL